MGIFCVGRKLLQSEDASSLINQIGLYSNRSLSYIKGCRSININSSVLIVFLIGKVITGFFCYTLTHTPLTNSRLVKGPGQNLLIRVGSDQFFVARVGLGQTFIVWVWILKISSKNVKFFNFLPFGSKKIALGRVRKYPGQSRVGLLFTAGQK